MYVCIRNSQYTIINKTSDAFQSEEAIFLLICCASKQCLLKREASRKCLILSYRCTIIMEITTVSVNRRQKGEPAYVDFI